MSGRTLPLIASNTRGRGRLFARAARAMAHAPVLVTARPKRYACLADGAAPAVIVVPRVDEDELYARDRFDDRAGVAGITSRSGYFVATAAAQFRGGATARGLYAAAAAVRVGDAEVRPDGREESPSGRRRVPVGAAMATGPGERTQDEETLARAGAAGGRG